MPLDELQHRLWNCDETGFCSTQACPRILAKRMYMYKTPLVEVEENTTQLDQLVDIDFHPISSTKERILGVDGCKVVWLEVFSQCLTVDG